MFMGIPAHDRQRRRAVPVFLALGWAVTGAAGQPGAGPHWQTPDPGPPNVVFILADDLGWGDLGCYGNDLIRTPRLDQLAEEGMLFTQFYVSASVCSPTRASFLTGRFPAELRIHKGLSADPQENAAAWQDDYLDPALPTITGLLQSAGYTTGLFGKWHLGSVPGAPDPGAYGIDDHVTVNSTGPGFPQQQPSNPYFRAESTEYIVDEAIRFIEENQDGPFFVNVWTLLPHATLLPTDQQLAVYADLAPPGVPFVSPRQVYYASVTAMDEQIGRLVDRIDELGLAGKTLVIFTSDNGPEIIQQKSTGHSGVGSAGPFRGVKRSLYEGGVRMPLIVRWPGRVPEGGVDRDSVVSIVDFLPTLCALAGGGGACADVAGPDPGSIRAAFAPSPFDGEDVSGILLGSPGQRSTPLLWQWRFGGGAARPVDLGPPLAIRSGRWKLLMTPLWSRVELYDLVADPMELDNVADEHPEIVSDLAAELLAWNISLPYGAMPPPAGEGGQVTLTPRRRRAGEVRR
jgi:arylsulfatase A-like enzyme